MVRITYCSGGSMQNESLDMISSDVNFPNGHFPVYKIGPNNLIVEPEDRPLVVPLKEIVAKETTQLLEQRERLSVRDIREKFEKGLASAAKLSEEARRSESASLDRQVLLKKLRDVLDSLRRRMVGRNKEDVDEAISLVEALAFQLTQREGELIHEKEEVKKLAAFLKQATEDAKKVVEEEKTLALAEIDKAKVAIERVEQALQEQEFSTSNKEKEKLDELRMEVQEARRIKMLHLPTRVLDMEHELRALRNLVSEKSLHCVQLKKELTMLKVLNDENFHPFELEGSEILGSCLRVVSRTTTALSISSCCIKWYRRPKDRNREVISGAEKLTYALEPLDVGKYIEVEISLHDRRATAVTRGPITPAPGLDRYVDALYKKQDAEFNVVVIQMNGHDYPSTSVHIIHVGKHRIKLRKGRSTKARELYSGSMQLFGAQVVGHSPPNTVIWQAKKGLCFQLAFETSRERNAAIMLARQFASDCNFTLVGPGDRHM